MKDDRIRSRDEETTCEWCGFPLYVGDSVVFRDDLPFCGRPCASTYRERRELHLDEVAATGGPR